MIVKIDYTNHRGERAVRRIRPLGFSAQSEFHPGEPVVVAFDLDKQAIRSFALNSIHKWFI